MISKLCLIVRQGVTHCELLSCRGKYEAVPFQIFSIFTSGPSFIKRTVYTVILKGSETLQNLLHRHHTPSNQQLHLQKHNDNSNVPQCCGAHCGATDISCTVN